jgi:hypothetical protein
VNLARDPETPAGVEMLMTFSFGNGVE